MVGTIGYQLQRNRRITGFGVLHHPRRHYGSGVVCKVASEGTRALGTYIVNRLADAIEG